MLCKLLIFCYSINISYTNVFYHPGFAMQTIVAQEFDVCHFHRSNEREIMQDRYTAL